MSKIKQMIVLLLVVVVTLGISGCMSVQQRLKQQARSGNHSSQALLAESYLRGYDAAVDYNLARRWALQGAQTQEPLALFVLGEIYHYGYGAVSPNSALAMDYYRRAWSGLKKSAEEGNIHAAYDIGMLYSRGLIVDLNYTWALYYFRRGIVHGFPPSMNQLGICYRDGLGVKKNYARAKYYFLNAAQKDYPAAQYNLAMQYFRQKNYFPARAWMRKAVQAKYPPAMTRMAEWQRRKIIKTVNGATSRTLYREAAESGYPEAQFALAELLRHENNLEDAIPWLIKAIERSYNPAMVKFAEISAQSEPVKSLILLQVAENNGAPRTAELSRSLDAKSGMALPVAAIWQNIASGEFYLREQPDMQRIINGYRAGIVQGSHELFIKALRDNPQRFYLNCLWQSIIARQLPSEWGGEIFACNLKKYRQSPAFWLSYATYANWAGHGAAAMYGAMQLERTLKDEDNRMMREQLGHLAAVIKCAALVILGHDDEGYELLFKHGRIPSEATIINYINHWALPVLKSRRKFVAATAMDESKLRKFTGLPKYRPFHDLPEGNGVPADSKIPQPPLIPVKE